MGRLPEQYRRKVYEENRRLEQRNEELEQKIAEKTVTLSDLMTQINRAHKAVKGLTTMINNLNAEKKRIESELAALRETTATTDAERIQLEKQIAEKEMQLSKIDEGLADKAAKLEKAQDDLEKLESLISDEKSRHDMMQRSMRESSRSMQSQVSSKLVQVGFEEMINAVAPLLYQMTSEKDAQLFDGTLLKDMAERGNHIFTCASLLFVGYIDRADTGRQRLRRRGQYIRPTMAAQRRRGRPRLGTPLPPPSPADDKAGAKTASQTKKIV